MCKKWCILKALTKIAGLSMNYNELIKLMKKAGWQFERNGKGSHKIWFHPNRPNRVAVPDHGSKKIDPALLRGIKKQTGI